MTGGEGAALAAMGREAHDTRRRRFLDIGIGANDEGGFAAQFHDDTLQGRRRLRLNHRADLVRAGEMDEIDARIGGQQLAGFNVAGDDAQHALGQADLVRDFAKDQRFHRRIGRWLQHNCAAGRQRRNHLADIQEEREIIG